MIKRKINFILLFSIIIIVTFTSCGSEITGSASEGETEQNITLKLWHIWVTDSDSNKRPFVKALKEWNDTHPGMQIEASAAESEAYKIKLRTAIAVNEAPDIFYGWGAGFSKPFVESGKILILDEYLDERIKDRMVPGSLENFTYEGKVYALPTFMIAGIFYCNTELFEQYNVNIPETFDELLEAVKTFRENGVTPMAVGLKDGWPGIFFQNILAIRTAGVEKCISALNKEISFNQREFVESARLLTKLIDAGAFDTDSMEFTQYEAESTFLNGSVAMYYCGSWSAGSMDREDCPVKGKVAVRNFPVVEGASGDENGFLGGAIDNFMISSSTPYKKEAVDAMTTICENFCKESYLSGAGIPAWKAAVNGDKASPLAAEISSLIEGRDGFVLAWDTFLSGSAAQRHIDLVTDIYAGKLTPEEFAVEMQKLNMNVQE